MWSVECGVWSVECGVWGVECGMWSVECGVHPSLTSPYPHPLPNPTLGEIIMLEKKEKLAVVRTYDHIYLEVAHDDLHVVVPDTLDEERINKVGPSGLNVEAMGEIPEEAVEKILSFMTTPNLLIPLLLEFIMNGHVRDLQKKELQEVLDCSLFELQAFRRPGELESKGGEEEEDVDEVEDEDVNGSDAYKGAVCGVGVVWVRCRCGVVL